MAPKPSNIERGEELMQFVWEQQHDDLAFSEHEKGMVINFPRQFPTFWKTYNQLKAREERLVREAQIDELDRLIPSPVAEMASIDYEDELKRLYDDIYNRKSELTQQGTQDSHEGGEQ